MPTFAIQRGAGTLCSWDVDTGRASCHERAVQQNGMLVVEETSKLTLVVHGPTEGYGYRITIGDVPLADMVPIPEDAGGIGLGDRIIWRELAYFESARGHTRLLLERQAQDSDSEQWVPVIAVEVYVVPSKLGEDRYEAMADDLGQISRSLLVDLYGKSRQTHDLRLAREGRAFHSREQELQSI